MAGLAIRDDLSPAALRRLARREKGGRAAARMYAIANALEGMRRAEAARLAGLERQALRDAVLRYNAEGPSGLRDRARSGRRPKLDEGQQAVLRAQVLRGPEPERSGLSAWRIVDICQLVEERFGIHYSYSGMHRLISSLELSPQKTRPRHPEADPKAQEAFKKTSPPS